MLSDWYLVIRGDPSGVALVQDITNFSTEHAIEVDEESGEVRLRSTRLSGIPDHETVWATGRELLIELTDAAAAHAGIRIQTAPGSLGRTTATGNDLWVFPEAIAIRASTFPPTILVDGKVVGEPAGTRLLRLGAAEPNVRLAIHFLNGEESWFDLYKAFEAIAQGNGGENRLIDKSWTTRVEIRRFTHTANSYAVTGDAARHAALGRSAPKKPMTLAQADEFVRRLMSRWLAELP